MRRGEKPRKQEKGQFKRSRERERERERENGLYCYIAKLPSEEQLGKKKIR